MRARVSWLCGWVAACSAGTDARDACERGVIDADALLAQTGAMFAPPAPLEVMALVPRVRAADVDQDGVLELLVSTGRGLAVLGRDTTSGAFVERRLIGGMGTVIAAFDVGDLDGDGGVDVVTLDGRGILSVILAAAVAPIVAPSFQASDLRTVDLDGDGRDELLLVLGDILQVLSLQGDRMAHRSVVRTVGGAQLSESGDWDGDGDLDLALLVPGNAGPQVEVMPGDAGSQAGLAPSIILPASQVLAVASMRVDDGEVLAVAHRRDQATVLETWGHPAGGAGVLEPLTSAVVELANVDSIAAADVDGDGRDELLVSAISTFVFRRDAAGNLGPSALIARGKVARSSRRADLDGDGRDDLILSDDAASPPHFADVHFVVDALPAASCALRPQAVSTPVSPRAVVSVEAGDSIQAAVDRVAMRGVVLVGPGTYRENVVVRGQVVLRSTAGRAGTIIEGVRPGPVVWVSDNGGSMSELWLEGFTIRGGAGVNDFGVPGYGVAFSGMSLVGGALIGSTVTANEGGGVLVESGFGALGAQVLLDRNEIHHNVGGRSGEPGVRFTTRALHLHRARLTMYGNVLWENSRGMLVSPDPSQSGVGAPILTAVNNTIASSQGGTLLECSELVLLNNIISGDGSATEAVRWDSGVVDYNLITFPSPVSAGPHQVIGDPMFVDAAGGDFRLRPGSPAIDTGTTTLAPPIDAAGQPRPQGLGVDMGAYEQ